jgi:signal transduction histidine kinase
VEQVLSNLLANAAKYGRGKPIEVILESDAASARLIVRDHGIGIAPADKERIFGRFERAVSARHYGGLGLGLYISRQLVDAHGGTMRVESELAKGATFTVELPREPPAAKVKER